MLSSLLAAKLEEARADTRRFGLQPVFLTPVVQFVSALVLEVAASVFGLAGMFASSLGAKIVTLTFLRCSSRSPSSDEARALGCAATRAI